MPRNGQVKTGTVTVREPGYYTWVASISGDAEHAPASHRCGMRSETTLVHKRSYRPVEVSTGYTGRAMVRELADTMARLFGRAPAVARLRYQGVGAVAAVRPVGISRGKMDVPANAHKLGRLAASAEVGDLIGTTVIAGHVSDPNDRAGAFGRLASAKKGDIVRYRDTDGAVVRYSVTGTATYSRERPLPRKLFSTTGAHRLVLISCTDRVSHPGGGWHYRKNIVVTATPVG